MRVGNIDWGPKSFKIFYCWLKDKSFDRIVRECWSNTQLRGWGGHVLKVKIKKLKEVLKVWSREHYGDTLKKVQRLEADLNSLEIASTTRQLTTQELLNRRKLQEDLWLAAQCHESLMRQKAREKWIEEGDCNTRYFHLLMNSKRSNTEVKGVLINGIWVEDPISVKEEVRRFFNERFTEPEQRRPILNGTRFQGIGLHHNEMLVANFLEDEIQAAVWECGSEKSPGPDGLNFKFIKHFWRTMKPDISRFIAEFHANGAFPRGSNASFIALIPKKRDPQNLNECRPISLIGCIYKIVAKLLANRLKKILSEIIDVRQSAFISGRQLLHSVVIANEMVEEAKRKHKPCLVFKVDYERAYNSISWEFLSYMMTRLGFCQKWISWIENCLKSATVSVLVNGSPTNEFTPQRGLRQGDPLAPLLFNIAAEGLTGLMREALDKNLYSSFLVGTNSEPVNILQYADDTIFLGETTLKNVKTIKSLLRSFELASGLKINFAKGSFGAIGKSAQWTKSAAEYLNCRTLSLPFLYLGIPIGVNLRRTEFWDPIICKCERKLAAWKHRHISFGGRVTLINTVLSTLPIYFFPFFRVPSKIIAKLESLQRRFLWGGEAESRKIAWVNWNIVCLPKAKGGLGIKDLRTFNTALLGKWRWDLFYSQQEPWAKVLHSKYGGWRALEEGSSGSKDSAWWKDLIKTQQLQRNLPLKRETIWKVGGRDKIKFWEDLWTNTDLSLRDKFPRLYQISCHQQQTIQQLGTITNSGWEWQLNWRRPLFDSEIAMADSFLGEITQQQIHPQREDKWLWKPEPGGHYSTKSGYHVLWGELTEEIQDADFAEIWKLKIPTKTAVFTWRLVRDRLPTKSNLRRRQVMVQDMFCPLCNNIEEGAAHLFFNCTKTLPLWWESMSWVNLKTAMPQTPRQHFLQYGTDIADGLKSKRWKCWWIALTWTIWQHRNKVVFQNATFHGNKVLEDALLLLWSWFKAMEKDFNLHFNQWSSGLRDAFCN
ncbi:hypothetical protein GYH30_044590 [Glycine max]|nr:hypothetical protein GYH30_044590 [Glycine max]